MFRVLVILCCFILPVVLFGTDRMKKSWAEETLSRMTIEEKVGQLFIGCLGGAITEDRNESYIDFITQHHLGGVVMMAGTIDEQIRLVNRVQAKQKIPLLIAQDAENGVGMRVTDATKFPRNLALGAIQNEALLYDFGREVGKECRGVGVRLNFAPVVDVNVNPNNPVINDRSFGDDPERVARDGIQFMKGLQTESVLACAKHFPGHGDTVVDSHVGIATVTHDRKLLEEVDLLPFKRMIEEGVDTVMIAHLAVPALDPKEESISSMSRKVITDLLRKELRFEGLIITDSLVMHGVSKSRTYGKLAVDALSAGSDLLLYNEITPEFTDEIYDRFLPEGIKAIISEVKQGMISEIEIDEHVLRILRKKESLGLYLKTRIAEGFKPSKEAEELKMTLYENAVTAIFRDGRPLLPLKKQNRVVIIEMGSDSPSEFYKSMSSFGNVVHVKFNPQASMDEIDSLVYSLKNNEIFVVSMMGVSRLPKNQFNIKPSEIDFIKKLQGQNASTIIALFGNPYSLQFFPTNTNVIIGYDTSSDAQKAVAKVLYGLIPAKGKLPIKQLQI